MTTKGEIHPDWKKLNGTELFGFAEAILHLGIPWKQLRLPKK